MALFAAWLTIGLIPPIWRSSHRDGLDCSFVAVGHGACVVLQTPSGKTLLYDAGSLGSPHHGARTIADFLWSQGITRIDGIVLSHADIDHYNAVPDLLHRFDVGAVFVSPVMFEPLIEPDGLDAVSELRRNLDVAGVRIREIEAGDRLDTGDAGLRITVLHPPAAGVLGSDNANSIVLLLEYEGRRILLPGDLEPPGLDNVLAELPVDCDIALAPHHGSPQSDPLGLAAWCSPEWVVVSGGRPADEGEVEAVFREAGAEVLHTYESGMVGFSIQPSGIRVRTWLGR
jgi:competence protein ComEC